MSYEVIFCLILRNSLREADKFYEIIDFIEAF